MNLLVALVAVSSFAFIGYGLAYFISPYIKSEFKRFGVERYGVLVAVLELLGAIGLLVGLRFNFILAVSAAGLAVLMLLGVGVRIKVGDSVLVSLPALFFSLLNGFIFYLTVQ